MIDLLIPLVSIVVSFAVIAFAIWVRHKNRESMQQTFRSALEKGQELTPEIIDRLGSPSPSKDKDMRLGVIWLAIALALGFFGFSIPDDEANSVMIGIAAFPFCIGIGYVILHFFTDRD